MEVGFLFFDGMYYPHVCVTQSIMETANEILHEDFFRFRSIGDKESYNVRNNLTENEPNFLLRYLKQQLIYAHKPRGSDNRLPKLRKNQWF
jgi:hypothetical protein